MSKFLAKLIYKCFAQWLPKSNAKYSFGSKRIRLWCARRIMCKCDKTANIERKAYFSDKVSLGAYSSIGVNSELCGPITIGDNVMMGPEVIMYTQNHEFVNPDILIQKQGYREIEPIHIGNDVWIGRRVIILPGVTVGNGAVIGAGAVVAKDIPEYSIVVGNPIRIIGYRYNYGDKINE